MVTGVVDAGTAPVDEILTLWEASVLAGVPPWRARRAIERGELRARRVGTAGRGGQGIFIITRRAAEEYRDTVAAGA